MYIGLMVIVTWVGFQRLRAGAWRTVLGIFAALVVGVFAVARRARLEVSV